MSTRKKTTQKKTMGTPAPTTFTIQNCSVTAESAKIPPELAASMSCLAAAAQANATAIAAIAAIPFKIEAGRIGTGLSINSPQGDSVP